MEITLSEQERKELDQAFKDAKAKESGRAINPCHYRKFVEKVIKWAVRALHVLYPGVPAEVGDAIEKAIDDWFAKNCQGAG